MEKEEALVVVEDVGEAAEATERDRTGNPKVRTDELDLDESVRSLGPWACYLELAAEELLQVRGGVAVDGKGRLVEDGGFGVDRLGHDRANVTGRVRRATPPMVLHRNADLARSAVWSPR